MNKRQYKKCHRKIFPHINNIKWQRKRVARSIYNRRRGRRKVYAEAIINGKVRGIRINFKRKIC